MSEAVFEYNPVLIESLQHYESDPIAFCEDLLGIELDEWQKDASRALVKDHFVAIKAGSGVGKSFWASLMTMWFLGTKPFSKVPTTAPSQHQLFDVLWAEHHKNISRNRFLNSQLVWTGTKVQNKKYGPQWQAVARTARVSPNGKISEGLQGFHAEENLLYIADEASGIPDEIFPAIEGALTGKKAYAILISNPTRLSGYFHSLFTDPKLVGLYQLFTVSCLDSKHVEERYIRMMQAKYGINHPIYQIKVLGEFPKSDSELLFVPEDIALFENNGLSDVLYQGMNIEFGVDVGRSENRSICCIRQGERILKFEEKYLTGGIVDQVEIEQWIIELMHAYNPTAVKVDAIGIGSGVYDHLKRVYPKIIMPVIGNAGAIDQHRLRYVNLRAQGYWNLKMLLPTLCCEEIPERLLSEMGNLKHSFPNGKIKIESKDEFRGRGFQSPDYLDSMMYAFMDEETCLDKFFTICAPIMLTGTLEGLTKTSILDMGPSIDMNETSGKWSVLHA